MRPCRINYVLYPNVQTAARKLKLHHLTVTYRLHSPYWHGWKYISYEEAKKNYSGNFLVPSIPQRLKRSRPIVIPVKGEDRIFISCHDAMIPTGYTAMNIYQRVIGPQYPDWRYATQEEIQHALDNELFHTA